MPPIVAPPPSITSNTSGKPARVVTVVGASGTRSSALKAPSTTWLVRIEVRVCQCASVVGDKAARVSDAITIKPIIAGRTRPC